MFEGDGQDFAALTPDFTLARFMFHYELFKKIMDKPGALVDIGVGRGASTWAFGAMCQIFFPQDPEKCIYGFDTFTGFPAVAPEDGSHVKVGRMALVPHYRQVPAPKVSLIKGDIVDTVPAFVTVRPGLRLALLNLDADIYLPTKAALEFLEPLVVPGGIIIVDEYDLEKEFPGERKAVDQYYTARIGRAPIVHRVPWCDNPSGYIVKGAE